MKKYPILGYTLAGLGAGCVAGLFGAGGGMVLIPLLTALTDISEEALFPSSIAVILPICLVTLVSTAILGDLPWAQALPYLLGSGIGGYLAGKLGKKIPVKYLHRALGLLILWGGVRYLWGS